MKRIFLAACWWLIGMSLIAQEQDPRPVLSANGYVKDLQSVFLIRLDDSSLGPDTTLVLSQNFIHNRINTRLSFAEGISLKTDLRTRLFWGDEINELFLDQLESANDFLDLSVSGTNGNGLAYHSMIDRLYLEYTRGNWEVRLGRQRINWGINTAWNPNDVFNAFAFTDFDYEERPGSDALRVRYFTGFASSVELAVKAADRWEEAVLGGLLKINKWNYDLQFLAGVAQNEFFFGTGWAGNIKTWGFKGEATYFQPLQSGEDPSFAAAVGADYLTGKGIFLNLGFLYNSNGQTEGSLASIFDFELSAKNLYPYRYTVFTQVSYPFNPLLTGSFSVLYSPSSAHAFFINPVATYSIDSNWDIDLVGQLALNQDGGFKSPIQGWFLRVKWSY